MQQSLERPRNADQFVDAITAEDIGTFPDQNLAESLPRVSGVTIYRKSGEGAFVSVRGLGLKFVQATINACVSGAKMSLSRAPRPDPFNEAPAKRGGKRRSGAPKAKVAAGFNEATAKRGGKPLASGSKLQAGFRQAVREVLPLPTRRTRRVSVAGRF